MSWKLRAKIALGGFGLIVFISLIVIVIGLFSPMIYQMRAGRKYMESLTDIEIQKWIERSKEYLAHTDSEEHPIGARPVPPDLRALKILRIDLRTNSVVYVWCGGLEHTYLTVKEMAGQYEVIAGYDDRHSQVLWPRKN